MQLFADSTREDKGRYEVFTFVVTIQFSTDTTRFYCFVGK
jgi:hypothetical protein